MTAPTHLLTHSSFCGFRVALGRAAQDNRSSKLLREFSGTSAAEAAVMKHAWILVPAVLLLAFMSRSSADYIVIKIDVTKDYGNEQPAGQAQNPLLGGMRGGFGGG